MLGNSSDVVSYIQRSMVVFDQGGFIIDADHEHGGKIISIYDKKLRRNLLAAESEGCRLACEDGAIFSAYGWDEVIPTLEPYENLPRLGYAWRSVPAHSVCDGRLKHTWNLPGWSLCREITADESMITAKYEIRNTGDIPSAAIWAAHVLFSFDEFVEAGLPIDGLIPGPMCYVIDLKKWVMIEDDTMLLRNTGNSGLSWKYYLNAERPVELRYRDATVSISTDAPWWGIWYNLGRIGSPCIGIEPTNNPTDYIQDARSKLPPGEKVYAELRMHIARY